MVSKIYIEIEGEQAELLQYLEQLQKLPRPASIKWKSEKPTPTDWANVTLTREELYELNQEERMRYYQAHGGWHAVMAEVGGGLSDNSAQMLLELKQQKRQALQSNSDKTTNQ
jgi:hypothetical protein